MHTTIIDTQTLSKHLDDPNWLILDCRFNLTDKNYGEQVYAEGHISRARYLNLDHDLSSPVTADSGRHPLPNPEELATKLSGLGMHTESQVVVYDDCGGAMAVRAWWLLRWMGHQAVAVLDGGYPEWIEQQGRIEQVVQEAEKGNFRPRLQFGETVETQKLLNTSEWVVVDARSTERFRGYDEPIDPVAGRIPGAVSRPLTENLHQGLFKTAKQLRAEWEQLLEDVNPKKVVHMCGSGVTACHNQLAMEIAGIKGSCLYAGSWSEWIRDPDRPIATG